MNRNSNPPLPWWSALVLGLMGLPFVWVDTPSLLQPSFSMFLVGVWLAAQGSLKLIQYVLPTARIPERHRP